MKNLTNKLFAFACIFGLLYCSPEKDLKQTIDEGTFHLSFSLKNNENGRITDEANLPDVIFAVITIENSVGDLLIDSKKVELFNLNDEYITTPIALLAGDHNLVEFYIVDNSNNVLLATPKSGSALADLVEQPLPISFSISKDKVTKLTPEVITVIGQTPEDFGYLTFNFDVVETFDFLIAVLIPEDGNFVLTTSDLIILHDSDTLFKGTLEAKTNRVKVPEGLDNFIVIVKKIGFVPYIKAFTSEKLKSYFSSDDNGPLSITLDISGRATLTTDQTVLENVVINFDYNETPVEIAVDWGDGTVETLRNTHKVTHTYSIPDIYTIIISGDLNVIKKFYTEKGRIIDLDVTAFINMVELGIWNTHIKDIDLSGNTALEISWFPENDFLEQIILSENFNLKTLIVDNCPQLKHIHYPEVSSLQHVEFWNSFQTNFEFQNQSDFGQIELLTSPNLNTVQLYNLEFSSEIWRAIYIIANPNLQNVVLEQIGEIDVLAIVNGDLQNLDLTGIKEISHLHVNGNGLTSLDVRRFKNLVEIDAKSNEFDDIAVNNILAGVLYSVENLNLRSGTLNLSSNTPPSGQGIIDKNKLIDEYGWKVITD